MAMHQFAHTSGATRFTGYRRALALKRNSRIARFGVCVIFTNGAFVIIAQATFNKAPTTRQKSGAAGKCTYDADDRLIHTVKIDNTDPSNDRNTVYTYSDTKRTSKTTRTGATVGSGTIVESQTSMYNAEGRMSQVTVTKDGATTTTKYQYNDNGIRVEKSVTKDGTTTTTEYLYDPNNPTGHAQVLEQGTDSNHDGKLEANEIDKTFILGQNVLAQVTGAQLLSFLYDLHGSTRALVDTNGTIHDDTAGGKGIQGRKRGRESF